MNKIKLRATRPLHMQGKLVAAGDIFSVDAAAAAEALSSTRCELVDLSDRAAMLTAATKAKQDAVSRQRLMSDPGDGPWTRIN